MIVRPFPSSSAAAATAVISPSRLRQPAPIVRDRRGSRIVARFALLATAGGGGRGGGRSRGRHHLTLVIAIGVLLHAWRDITMTRVTAGEARCGGGAAWGMIAAVCAIVGRIAGGIVVGWVRGGGSLGVKAGKTPF